MSASAPSGTWPLLPLREVVVFPHTPMSLIIGRPKSLAAVEVANQREPREIFLAAQRSGENANPDEGDVFPFGTIATIEQVLNLPDGNTKILVEGLRRARIVRFTRSDDWFEVELEEFPPEADVDVEVQALVRTVKTTFERYVKLNRAVPPEMLLTVNALEDPDRLADTLVAPLQFKLEERQELLETVSVGARLERIYKALLTEIEFLQVEKKLKSRVKRERETNQREYWLNEQMKAIQKELGDKEGRSDLEELAQALAAKNLPADVQNRAEKELRKLSQMNTMSAEATVVRNYLDWVVALPWTEESEGETSLAEAARVLDAEHFGLRRIKERILEYLAVSTLVDKMRGPILCLVGPPGVGKTSLARSIANATQRPFVKISLGGVRDEAEIRGHRRTYIGAMPGKLLHAMKRAEKVDPVILLDEVDKMSADFRGDPSAALLEVLDPEQNTQFQDHYLDIDYDLSKVTFICTANTLQGIPLPLQDRLEIIELSGYTEQEKVAIARKYLLPRQQELNGIGEQHLEISNKALLQIIRGWTKESGVRDLERQLARISRKVARRVVKHGPETHIKVVSANLEKLLGAQRFLVGQREKEDQIGLVKGLAVSPWGGELLNIEVAAVPGKGKLELTGRLGEWLQESGRAGFTYLRSRAEALGLESDFHETHDLHVHYPGNALKTDGPSAGIAMATAMVSALTGIPVRADTAMTGEITLRGRVLPIGGLKEKVLAAHRGGITRVLVPDENVKDLEDIPANIRAEVDIIPVGHMDRVLKEALASPPVFRGDSGAPESGGVASSAEP
ncbi:MAG: endopeptidase La [Alphaproteobacteria bacterium]|nr:endopeptidase La [Alphaproteobacteria bacterium]MCB9695727.1 endopeptidase La [Alphaproteobacteria bacterium]